MFNDDIALAYAEGSKVHIARTFVHGCIEIPAGVYDVCGICSGTGFPPYNTGTEYCMICMGTGIVPQGDEDGQADIHA